MAPPCTTGRGVVTGKAGNENEGRVEEDISGEMGNIEELRIGVSTGRLSASTVSIIEPNSDQEEDDGGNEEDKRAGGLVVFDNYIYI